MPSKCRQDYSRKENDTIKQTTTHKILHRKLEPPNKNPNYIIHFVPSFITCVYTWFIQSELKSFI